MPGKLFAIDRSSGAAGELHDRVVEAYEDARLDVYYYVLRLGLAPGQAQEVAQEVFLRLYTTLRAGEDIINIRGWVFRVAHNLALKTRSKEREHSAIEGYADLQESTEADPEQRAIQTERQRKISEALADLSPQQRQCLDLRAAGLRYREIAATVGIGTSTVNEFLRRAIAKLRKALNE